MKSDEQTFQQQINTPRLVFSLLEMLCNFGSGLALIGSPLPLRHSSLPLPLQARTRLLISGVEREQQRGVAWL